MEAYNKIVKDLKLDYPKLSDYELLSIAVQQQRNEILIAGLNVSRTDKYPSAIEAIAIQLGFSTSNNSTIMNSLNNISENLEK